MSSDPGRPRKRLMLPESERSWRLSYFEEVGASLGRSFEVEAVAAARALELLHARRRRATRESTTFTLAFYFCTAAILALFPSTRGSALSLAGGSAILAVALVLLAAGSAFRERTYKRTPSGVRGVQALGGFAAIPAVAARSLTRQEETETTDEEYLDLYAESPLDLGMERALILDAYTSWLSACLPDEAARDIYLTLLHEFEGPLGEIVIMSRSLT